MEKKKLFALFVGIDNYPPSVPSLAGCVNDMMAVKEFIERRTLSDGFELHSKTLVNHEATRINIVREFEEHLAKAGENDVALFYYSGHGSQEHAHQVFWATEPDRLNETIVCYDSRTADGMDLADKELATLIEVVADKNPHILVIMDCCNSGSGTRSIREEDEVTFVPRMLKDTSSAQRSLDSYILPKSAVTARGTLGVSEVQEITLPQSRHITLSAAHSFELAKETRLGGTRRGVFTYSLLEVLNQARGPLSYADVMRRVRGLVTQRTFDQNPQLYVYQEGDMDLPFLGGAITDSQDYYLLSFHAEHGWTIDAGAVHGIAGPDIHNATTELAVFEEHLPDADMTVSRSMGKLRVTGVQVGFSQVEWIGGNSANTSLTYKTRVISTPQSSIKVFLGGDDQQGMDTIQDVFTSQDPLYLDRVEGFEEADYLVLAKRDIRTFKEKQVGGDEVPGFFINRPTDFPDQPLVEQVKGFSREGAEKILKQMNHIARWEKILKMANPGSSISSESVRLELYGPKDNRILPGSGGIVFEYSGNVNRSELPQFKLKLVNASPSRVYCVLLYMSSQFGIETRLFGEGGIWLEPGGEAWVLDGKVFTGTVPNVLFEFGKSQVHEIFKLIASTSEYDASALRMNDLNLPITQTRTRNIQQMDTRALFFSKQETKAIDDWNTTELYIKLKRLD
ncbi:MAG: caspase family protein [Bacteroidota bacterium]